MKRFVDRVAKNVLPVKFYLLLRNLSRIDEVQVGRNVVLQKPIDISHSIIQSNVMMREGYNELIDSSLGEFTYVARYTSIKNADIGKFCAIASMVSIGTPAKDLSCVTIHEFPFFEAWGFVDRYESETSPKRVVIGNDVWIGFGAIVMPGVRVGDGAVVGANAVVTKDVEPYSIVAGSPAKLIRKRFEDKAVEKLLSLRWWDWPVSRIREHLDDFYDLSKFLAHYTEER